MRRSSCRLVMPVVALLSLGACARHEPARTVGEYAREPRTWCFHSTQGIDVFAGDADDCPSPTSFSSDASRVMRNAGLMSDAFIGVRVVYVRGEIECNGIQTLGCTDVNRRVSLVSLDCPWPRRLTRHELAHQAVRAGGMPEHAQSHDGPWWRGGLRGRLARR